MSDYTYFASRSHAEVFYRIHKADNLLFYYNFRHEDWCFITGDKTSIANYERPVLMSRLREQECLDAIDSIKTMRELIS